MRDPAIENVQWIAAWSRQEQMVAQWPTPLRKIGSIGIVGAGMMGTAIAAAHLQYRLPVVIHDVNETVLGKARATVADELTKAGGHMAAGTQHRLLCLTRDLADVAGCDLVIEAIAETLTAKRQLFALLQPHLSEQTIVASNTSTIPLERLAQGMTAPSRFCGMHFCHPVAERPLVELVYGPQTAPATLDAIVAHVRRIGRMPMSTPDGPGFVVNRLLFPYLAEALESLQEGHAAESIESAAAEFGMAIGPLRLMDEIGLDTTLRAGLVLATAFPERVAASPLLIALIKAGRLGRKTGAGFFSYTDEKCTSADSSERALPLPGELESRAGCEDVAGPIAPHRLVLPMLLEATRLLEEGKVRDAREVDLAVLFGLGFPAEKGGLLWWAETVGAKRIVALLQSLPAMGSRAEPTLLLKKLAATGGQFYPDHHRAA